MSTAPSAATPTSQSAGNFVSIFNAALESYRRKTKKDLVSHPLLPTLQSCESPEGVLAVLREQVDTSAFLSQSRIGDDDVELMKWVAPTVNVLYSLSGTVGQGVVGLVNIQNISSPRRGEFRPLILFYLQAFPPASIIFAGIGVLLSVSILHLSLRCDLS